MLQLLLNTKCNLKGTEITEALKSPKVGKNTFLQIMNDTKRNITNMLITWFFDLTVERVLQRPSISLLILPSEVTKMLYMEGVISKEIFDNLSILKCSIEILENSCFEKDILNDYGELFVLHGEWPLYFFIVQTIPPVFYIPP